jgi:hypothetical protein
VIPEDGSAESGEGAIQTQAQVETDSVSAASGQPAIKLRAAWNARAARYAPAVASQLKGAIIHHQAGSNTYTQAQVPGIIKGIQNWHMDGNGWDDIGYNFLVDKYGGVWEGRQGGITRNVVGAHAFEFNTGSTGVCFLGDLDTAQPSAVAIDAAGKLVAWRLSLAGIVDLKGTTVYPKDVKQARKPVVSGHRDVNSTTCPGRYLYAKLATLRTYRHAAVTPGPKIWTGASPDLTGDGRGDILVVDQAGDLFVYPMASATTLGTPYQAGHGWKNLTVLAPGDWNGDGRADIIGVTAAGMLYLYPGKASGFGSKIEIGHGWQHFDIHPSADVDGDGKPDMLAVDKRDGLLYLYRGNGRGGWITGRGELRGHSWLNYDLYPAGRINGDALADVFSINRAGKLFTYLSKPGGNLGKAVESGHGWQSCQLLSGTDLDGDKVADIAGICGNPKALYLYKGLGLARFRAKVELAENW